jgi:hypothetical protein
MLTKFLIAAAALSVASAAHAQKVWPPHVDMPIGAQLGAVQPANNDGTTVASTALPDLVEKASPETLEQLGVLPGARTADGTPVAARVPDPLTAVVTNGPVFDTPENRRLYPPLSRAGRATAPIGN